MSSRSHKARRRRARKALSNKINKEKRLPLAKISAGGWDMWFDKATKRPLNFALQFALNLDNIKDTATKMIKHAQQELRKAKR